MPSPSVTSAAPAVPASSDQSTVTSWGSAADRLILNLPPPASPTVASATEASTHVAGRSQSGSATGRVSASEFQPDAERPIALRPGMLMTVGVMTPDPGPSPLPTCSKKSQPHPSTLPSARVRSAWQPSSISTSTTGGPGGSGTRVGTGTEAGPEWPSTPSSQLLFAPHSQTLPSAFRASPASMPAEMSITPLPAPSPVRGFGT